MKKQSTEMVNRSSVVWENLEEWVRGRIQGYLQDLLEEEVTVFLGREKSERRVDIDGPGGYRNGYGKVRKLTLSCGTVELARPRVRGMEERFESRLLPLFVRRTETVAELLPTLYLHAELLDHDWERMVAFYRYPKEHWILLASLRSYGDVC